MPFYWNKIENTNYLLAPGRNFGGKRNIEKYKAIYQTKPQLLREKRYQNLRDLGLVSEKYALSPQVDKDNEWEQLSPVEREKYATVMATHAAMIDCIDQNIGRLITQLKEQGIYENTLITFSSDNGAINPTRKYMTFSVG